MDFRAKYSHYLPQPGEEFDVIVCGGGPAGIGAAVAACEAGAKTLLLEASSIMGGVAGAAMWMPVNRITLNGVAPGGGKRGGVHDRFVDAVQKYGGEAYSVRRHPATDMRGGLQIHPEYLRMAALDLLEDCGCKYRLFSPAVGVKMEGAAVRGVVVSTKDGAETFYAKRTVDCTGDGDVAAYAGVPMQKGRESDGIYLPPALLFTLSNVDIDRFYGFKLGRPDEYQAIIDLAAQQGYQVCRWYDFDETSLPGVVNVNNGGLPGWETLDMTRPEDRTIAERMGVQAAVDFANFARKLKMPGMEDCHLVRAGYQTAVRDTRRIVGEYLITHEDALNAPEFEDIVSRRYGFIDAVGYYQAEMVSGHAYPYPVTMEEMLIHCKAVRRGAPNTFVIGDMPYMSYQASDEEAVRNAGRFTKEALCDAVKLEGGGEEICKRIRAIASVGMLVFGHIGLTPQFAATMGGYKAQGKSAAAARKLLDEAIRIQEAGACALLVEGVPDVVGELITGKLSIPVLGIGAGSHTHGQLLIFADMVGLYDNFTPKFVKKYAEVGKEMERAFREYCEDVRAGRFPVNDIHAYKISDAERAKIEEMMR